LPAGIYTNATALLSMTFSVRLFMGEKEKLKILIKTPTNSPRSGKNRKYKVIRKLDVPDDTEDVGAFVAPHIKDNEYWVYADGRESVKRG
jgi:hypothetical protein